MKGEDLVGKRYHAAVRPLRQGSRERQVELKDGSEVAPYWRVIAADFVTLDAGTGIVHVAPAFGEDDYDAHRKELARQGSHASSRSSAP